VKKDHTNPLFERKQTTQFTEATLLRAMETAGKQIDDEDLRELMKENGIGRPSTRANIIETLLEDNISFEIKTSFTYSNRIQLIDTIQNELVKSAELTGSWEKQLKDIEKERTPASFINNMKKMIAVLVDEVRLNRDALIFRI
jgi:DNA topoisomerase-3